MERKPLQLSVITGDPKCVSIFVCLFSFFLLIYFLPLSQEIIIFPRKMSVDSLMMNSYVHREFTALPPAPLSQRIT